VSLFLNLIMTTAIEIRYCHCYHFEKVYGLLHNSPSKLMQQYKLYNDFKSFSFFFKRQRERLHKVAFKIKWIIIKQEMRWMKMDDTLLKISLNRRWARINDNINKTKDFNPKRIVKFRQKDYAQLKIDHHWSIWGNSE